MSNEFGLWAFVFFGMAFILMIIKFEIKLYLENKKEAKQ